MRVTMKIATNTTIDNILDNYDRVLNVQNQMSTGQRVNSPSDDPLAVNEGIRLQTLMNQIDQYDRNIEIGESFLGVSDTTLQGVNDALTSIKSLTIGMASDTTTNNMRLANVKEVGAMMNEIVTVGNRKVGGRYIFGGTQTTKAPLEVVGSRYVNYTGNEEDIRIQVDHSTYEAMNIKASDVFGSLITTERSDVLRPNINISVDDSTRLEDLNTGDGVSPGSIEIEYDNGAATINRITEIDLRSADTLEDVVDIIEQATNGDITVSENADHSGLVLTNTTGAANPIYIREVASNTTAQDLGILKSNTTGNIIAGDSIRPRVTENTLLADIPGYYGTPLSIRNGSDDLLDPEFLETADTNNVLSKYALTGLVEGENTDLNGNLFYDISDLGGNQWEVEVYKDSAKKPEDRVAVGNITTTDPLATVTLVPDNGSGVGGTVQLNTTIGGNNNTETRVVFPGDFRGTVQVEAFSVNNDQNRQLSGLQLYGLSKDRDTDVNGNMYFDITDIGGGNRQVDIYSDPLKSDLLATGQLLAADNGMVTLTGQPGHDDVSGEVYLEYTADDNDVAVSASFATVSDFTNAVNESGTYTKARVSDDGKAIQISSRLAGATLHMINDSPVLTEGDAAVAGSGDTANQFERWNVTGIEAGVNSGLNGELYGEWVQDPASTDYLLNFYSEESHDTLVAQASVAAPLGAPPTVLTINEVAGSSINGTVELDNGAFVADTDLRLLPATMGLSGKRREDNIFSTINDVIDAGTSNDTEELHNLIGNFGDDMARVLDGRTTAGSRMNRFEMLRNRLADEQTSFANIFSKRIDLDYADAVVNFQMQSNIYNSALSVAGRIIPMSLVDFI